MHRFRARARVLQDARVFLKFALYGDSALTKIAASPSWKEVKSQHLCRQLSQLFLDTMLSDFLNLLLLP